MSHTVNVIQREHAESDISFGSIEVLKQQRELKNICNDIVVTDHDTLRKPSGAARVAYKRESLLCVTLAKFEWH